MTEKQRARERELAKIRRKQCEQSYRLNKLMYEALFPHYRYPKEPQKMSKYKSPRSFWSKDDPHNPHLKLDFEAINEVADEGMRRIIGLDFGATDATTNYVFLDEYADINPERWEMIERMIERLMGEKEFCVILDPKELPEEKR